MFPISLTEVEMCCFTSRRFQGTNNVLSSIGLRATSSVRRPSNRDSSFKNSVLSNTKNSSEKVEVSDRTNKKPDVAFKNVVQIVLWIVDSGCSNHMVGDRTLLKIFVENFMGTVHFGNDHFTAIKCYEVAFRSKTCYVQNLEGDDLLSGDHESNLYTISIFDMAASSPVCLMFKATSTKSWLWHHRLSHLNFGTINDLTKHDLVDGLPKLKYVKDHLCSACEWEKSKKASHPPKLVPSTHSQLELLHIDLCGPMRVASINGNKYILVIVDDYSRFTWVYFLHTKDETLEIIKKFVAQVQLNYNAKVCKIRTNNAMASEHDSLEPDSQHFINDDSSAKSMNTPSKEDLDNLFGPMYEEYFEKKSFEMSINSAAQKFHNHEDSLSTSSIIIEE
ncbi:integrase, catalytic region, zinc finger, CCHC-type containing protein [Tanacetum coccineum]